MKQTSHTGWFQNLVFNQDFKADWLLWGSNLLSFWTHHNFNHCCSLLRRFSQWHLCAVQLASIIYRLSQGCQTHGPRSEGVQSGPLDDFVNIEKKEKKILFHNEVHFSSLSKGGRCPNNSIEIPYPRLHIKTTHQASWILHVMENVVVYKEKIWCRLSGFPRKMDHFLSFHGGKWETSVLGVQCL